jgi:hypothetical protein
MDMSDDRTPDNDITPKGCFDPFDTFELFLGTLAHILAPQCNTEVKGDHNQSEEKPGPSIKVVYQAVVVTLLQTKSGPGRMGDEAV